MELLDHTTKLISTFNKYKLSMIISIQIIHGIIKQILDLIKQINNFNLFIIQ